MKKIAKIRNFSQGGLNTDLPPHDLPLEYITDGNNFRCEDNSIMSYGGSREIGKVQDDYISHVVNAKAFDFNTWVFAGQKVWGYQQTSFALGDISPENLPTGSSHADKWSSTMMGNILVLNNAEAGLFYSPQPNPAGKFLPMPWDVETGESWADKAQFCGVIRAHKDRLIALNLNDNGERLPVGVRWSDPAESNDIPYTWDVNAETSANKVNLHDAGGDIVDGMSLRNDFIIYRRGAIWKMSPNSSPYVYTISKQTLSVGALSDHCVAEFAGGHVIFGDGDIVIFDGNSTKSIIHRRIKRRINNSIDPANFDKSFVMQNKIRKEIWFCFPTNGFTECNTAYIWRWDTDTWSVRDLPLIAHGASGLTTDLENIDAGTWDDLKRNDIQWGGDEALWSSENSIPYENSLIGMTKEGLGLDLDPQYHEISSDVETFFERTNIALESQQKVVSVDRLYPNCEGSGELLITLGAHDYAGSPIRWKNPNNPIRYQIGSQRKVDVRATGELIALRVQYVGKERFRFSGVDIEYTTAGDR